MVTIINKYRNKTCIILEEITGMVKDELDKLVIA